MDSLSASELHDLDLDTVPQYKLVEFQRHLRYLLHSGYFTPSPVFIACCEGGGRKPSPSPQEEPKGVEPASAASANGQGLAGARSPADAGSEVDTPPPSEHPSLKEEEKHKELPSSGAPATGSCSGSAAASEAKADDAAEVEKDKGPSEGGAATAPAHEWPTRSVIIAPSWREGALAAEELLLKRKLERAVTGDKVELTLRQINYSQDSIRGNFQDMRPLSQMRQELATGEKSFDTIPKITAVVWDGTIYSADNRRLWAFKHCGMPHDKLVPVIVGRSDEKFHQKLTTPSGGKTIVRRGPTHSF